MTIAGFPGLGAEMLVGTSVPHQLWKPALPLGAPISVTLAPFPETQPPAIITIWWPLIL